MNLSSSGMASTFRQDIVTRQLSRSASSGGRIFDPTSAAQKSNHETDKQAEDNATWFFEYKALLNSKLTTLTTTLTSAYTTDLDAAMARVTPYNPSVAVAWGAKNSMQGITGTQFDSNGDGTLDTTIVDPGAMRTTSAYLESFGFNASVFDGATNVTNTLVWKGDANSASSTTFNGVINGTPVSGAVPAFTNKFQGTTSFMTGSNVLMDKLNINLTNPLINDFENGKYFSNDQVAATPNTTWSGYPNSIKPFKKISNNVQLSLFKFFSRPENYDLFRFGLMDNIYVVGTSSLATGSQIQGSLSLKFQIDPGPTGAAYISINQERFSCFFHS